MAWNLRYRCYHIGNGTERRWYQSQESFFGRPFNTKRGVTQGGPVPLTIFNVVVDVVVMVVLLEVYVTQEAQHGFRCLVGEDKICFYDYDGRIEGRNPIWVQTALTAMVIKFERVVQYTV